MSSADILLREVRACTLCAEHLPMGPRPIVQMHPDARILIAGQAPGRKVHETGVPFNDRSGDRLRNWLGMTRETFYDPAMVALLPMSFCYPGKGKSGDLPPRPECAPAWRHKLLAQLPNLQMTLVIGQYALAWHLPKAGTSLTDTVQSWQQYWPAVVPMPHPSPRNFMWLRRNPWFEEDVIPAVRDKVREILS